MASYGDSVLQVYSQFLREMMTFLQSQNIRIAMAHAGDQE